MFVHEHINLHGRYYFGVTEAVQRGELHDDSLRELLALNGSR